MPLEKMICGENYTTELIKDNINGLIDDVGVISKKIPLKSTCETLVVLGASITQTTFNTSITEMKLVIAEYGFSDMSVVNEGVAGNETSDLLARLPAILANYSGLENIKFYLSIGGNNATNTQPFSTANISDLQQIRNDIVDIIDLIEGEGHEVFMANITWRNYEGVDANEAEGVLSYNNTIIEPIIKSRLPNSWDSSINRPIFDLYSWAFNNKSFISADRVHPTVEGYTALRRWYFERFARVIKSKFKDLEASSLSEVVIDAGTVDNSSVGIAGVVTDSSSLFSTFLIDGGRFSVINAGGVATTGKGNDGDNSVSLTNDQLLTNYIYGFTGGTLPCYINICNLPPSSTGKVTLTASRNFGSPQVGIYTVGGVSKSMNAIDVPAPQLEFNFEVNEYGTLVISFVPEDPSKTAIISGLKLVFD